MKLRFAPIIRVSTDKQARQGESLRTQKKEILEAVKALGGVIPDHCWKYSGQEHATGVEDRKKLDQLLEDSPKDLFDAVIVCDPTRYAKENQKSEEGLKIFMQNNIRFFILTEEKNLHNPDDSFILSLYAIIGKQQADQGSLKSIKNRIEIAKRGEPATRLPVGRTFNDGKWGVIPEEKETWLNIGEEFLEGKSFVELGEKYNKGRSHIRETLLTRCGTNWEQKFNSPRFKIKEIIPTKVPRLLPEEMIEAIRAKVEQNKTIFRKQTKNKYLLGRMLLCGHCGQALYGDSYKNGKRVYRHRHDKFLKGQRIPIGCNYFRYVSADMIENDIMIRLFSTFGDINMIEQAAKNALPDLNELKKLKVQSKTNNKVLKKIEIAKNRLFGLFENGKINADDIEQRMKKHDERENLLIAKNATIESQIKRIPFEKDITQEAKRMKRLINNMARNFGHLEEINFDEKRKLLQAIFSKSKKDEERPGIYLKKMNDIEKQPWVYEIKGIFNLIDDTGRLPMCSLEKRYLSESGNKSSYDYEMYTNEYAGLKNKLKTESGSVRVTCRAR